MSPTAHRAQAVKKCIAGLALPTAPGSDAVYCKSCIADRPKAMTGCILGIALFRQ